MYDMKNLDKMNTLEIHAPETMKAFVAFDKAALTEGAIPGKYKELMALALACTTQCPYCIDLHSNNARENGAFGAGDGRSRTHCGGAARGWGDYSRHARHERNLNWCSTGRGNR